MDQDGRAEEKSYDNDPGKHEPFEFLKEVFPGFNWLRKFLHIISLMLYQLLNLRSKGNKVIFPLHFIFFHLSNYGAQ